jgi:hypothetical protein
MFNFSEANLEALTRIATGMVLGGVVALAIISTLALG